MATKHIAQEFILARPKRAINPTAFFRSCRNSAPDRSTTARRHTRHIEALPSRAFSTTSSRSATVVKKNPRVDDDGNQMQINISERAAQQLKKIISAPPKKNTLVVSSQTEADSHLRVTVTAGGCHGFQYLMSLEPASKINPEDDTIFEFEDDGQGRRAEVVLDEPSLELLKGSTIDFTRELIGSQFKIVGNPRATSSCGCGTSFDIE